MVLSTAGPQSPPRLWQGFCPPTPCALGRQAGRKQREWDQAQPSACLDPCVPLGCSSVLQISTDLGNRLKASRLFQAALCEVSLEFGMHGKLSKE